MYLGAQLEHKTINHVKCWTMTSQKYIQAAVKKIEDKLKLQQQILSTKERTPFNSGYRPESDFSSELLVQDIRSFQEVVGILRWVVELCRINIMVEVSMLSSHLASPRGGHLEAVYHIIAYLKKYYKITLAFDPRTPVIDQARFENFD